MKIEVGHLLLLVPPGEVQTRNDHEGSPLFVVVI